MANLSGLIQSSINLTKRRWKEITCTVLNEGETTERRAIDSVIRGSNGDIKEILTKDDIKQVERVIFHQAEIYAIPGNIIDISNCSGLTLIITGTSTDKVLNYQIADDESGVFQAIKGYHQLTPDDDYMDSTTNKDTSSTPEIVRFDNLFGLDKMKIPITSNQSGGTVTVIGWKDP